MAKALVKNSADEAQVREAEKQEAFNERSKQKDLFIILQTYEGRKFFWELMGGSILNDGVSLMSETFNSHTSLMSYMSGKQAVLKQLLVKINEADPKAYTKMIEENLKREEQDNE